MKILRIVMVISITFFSCTSYYNSNYPEEISEREFNNTVNFQYHNLNSYQFHNSKILNTVIANRLNLTQDKNTQYVLFAQYSRNFLASSLGNERLYLIGERRLETEATFQTQEESYDIWLIVERNAFWGPHGIQAPMNEKDPVTQLRFSLKQLNSSKSDKTNIDQNTMKNFILAVHDFSGDGQDDLFFGFEQNRQHGRLYYYYVYSFRGMKLQAIVRPWNSFSKEEQETGIDKYYSPFMHELGAEIYPAFVAEIELDFNHKININLSNLTDVLIRDKVYNAMGMVLQKRGIPHLDSNPILFPVRHRSGQYMIRSVQQVRNRYGQIGIFVCSWMFQQVGEAGPYRWIPDESSMEFLRKPRI